MESSSVPGGAPAGAMAGQRRSLVPYLLVVLFLQGCLYLGLQAGPWFARYRVQARAERGPESIVRWRQAQYDPGRDPAVGMELPLLKLRDPKGRWLSLTPTGQSGSTALRNPGRGNARLALLLIGDGAS
jgi:hypothetical protein